MITMVTVLDKALKQIEKSPRQVQTKFKLWQRAVNEKGIEEVRKIPGYHDEPLKGERKNQRSIRLNKQWRAIYVIKDNGAIEFLEVKEITPHDY